MKYFDYLKSIVYIQQMHILANFGKSFFPLSADFSPLKFQRSLALEIHFLQHLEVSNVRPTDFLIS